jgi:hypothetical protein
MAHAHESSVKIALELMRGNQKYIDDARAGAPVGNSVVGSLLSIQHQIPRQYGEAAVAEALRILDAEPTQEEGDAITLTRTGQAPLRFTGELLEESDGHIQGGKDHNRWHELAVYRTNGGSYVVRIAYKTIWQGELDREMAEIVGKPEAVAEVLRDYDPTSHVQGYPPGEHYAAKQARTLDDIRRRYDAQVSEILASAPEFAEVVE